MKPRITILLLTAWAILVSATPDLFAQGVSPANPPSGIPTVSLNDVARHGFVYVGGQYVGELGPEKEAAMGGAMYVEVMVPKQIRSPFPVVFVHGAAQTGVDWLQTPDGRPGWAYDFLEMGYVVYLQDGPARGRSQYVPGVDGTAETLNLTILTVPTLEERFTAGATRGGFPTAKRHTQWPGTGRMGDKVFDDFAKTQVQFLTGGRQETLTRDANVALLDMIGVPVILVTHSQSGPFGWAIADARPDKVKAIVAVEPGGPPVKDTDTVKVTYLESTTGVLVGTGARVWGITNTPIAYEPAAAASSDLQIERDTSAALGRVACYRQKAPARKLKNLQNIPVLVLTGEASYHDVYDHCTARWLTQAGVNTDHVELEQAGMPGNGHMMMLEKNSADIARYMGAWLAKRAPAGRLAVSKALPPKTIPTFSTEHIARKGFFFAGGNYWGEKGREIMRGAMYTDVWVPKQIRQPNPIVIFHGNGQTGVDWLQTPDGRAGWAYHLVQQGYVVYMVDYPARGRSAYVPIAAPGAKGPIDGNLSIRTALELERIWTNVRERGDFPLKMQHTQWPGSGKMGDPIFDAFTKTQVQSAGANITLAREAALPLLDAIGTPVILLTHSQGGGLGFDVTEARPHQVKAMVTIEPGGPQIGGADTAKVLPGPRNPNSWGLTTNRYEYDPPAQQPSDLNVVLEEQSERPDEVRCWVQVEPARRLVRWKDIPVLSISGNGTYHRVYDPCIPKWLRQAGVKSDFVRLESVGLNGNGHMMMLEKNSDEIIKFIAGWIQKNVPRT
jgi:pimeloyl-ACP methyl ester carboxylesterase